MRARVRSYSDGQVGVLSAGTMMGSAEPQSREQKREPYCGKALVRRLGGSNYKGARGGSLLDCLESALPWGTDGAIYDPLTQRLN